MQNEPAKVAKKVTEFVLPSFGNDTRKAVAHLQSKKIFPLFWICVLKKVKKREITESA